MKTFNNFISQFEAPLIVNFLSNHKSLTKQKLMNSLVIPKKKIKQQPFTKNLQNVTNKDKEMTKNLPSRLWVSVMAALTFRKI